MIDRKQGLGWHLMARKCASGILKNDRFISCGNDAEVGYGQCARHLGKIKVNYIPSELRADYGYSNGVSHGRQFDPFGDES